MKAIFLIIFLISGVNANSSENIAYNISSIVLLNEQKILYQNANIGSFNALANNIFRFATCFIALQTLWLKDNYLRRIYMKTHLCCFCAVFSKLSVHIIRYHLRQVKKQCRHIKVDYILNLFFINFFCNKSFAMYFVTRKWRTFLIMYSNVLRYLVWTMFH